MQDIEFCPWQFAFLNTVQRGPVNGSPCIGQGGPVALYAFFPCELLPFGNDTGSPINHGAEDIEGEDLNRSSDWVVHFRSLVNFDSSANGELERIIVQRFTAIGFNNDGGAELQASFEITSDRVGLNDVHHVFDQCPRLNRVGGGTRPEFWGFSCFTVKDTVVGGKAIVFDDRAGGDNFLAGRPRLADLPDIFVALQSRVEELAIER